MKLELQNVTQNILLLCLCCVRPSLRLSCRFFKKCTFGSIFVCQSVSLYVNISVSVESRRFSFLLNFSLFSSITPLLSSVSSSSSFLADHQCNPHPYVPHPLPVSSRSSTSSFYLPPSQCHPLSFCPLVYFLRHFSIHSLFCNALAFSFCTPSLPHSVSLSPLPPYHPPSVYPPSITFRPVSVSRS